MDQRVRKLRRAFRYLKRGVFSPELIDEFTVGRATELAAVENRLKNVEEGSTSHVFLEGTYGRGKSHMLKAIEAVALRKGFAVAWVTLDGQNHACNHPTRYFHSLLESLRVPDSATRGLSLLVKGWLKGEGSASIVKWATESWPWLRSPILECQRNPDALEQAPYLNAWIESRDIIHYNGKPWFDEVSRRMQSTAALVRAAGFRGVAYLFDELETVATLLWSIRQRFLSYEFLNLLVDGRKHAHCFFAFATTPDFGTRVASDRTYHSYYATAYPEGFRFTQKWQESSIDLIQLRSLKNTDLVNYCRSLRGYHEEAFMWKVNGCFSDKFLRAFIEETERLNLGVREVVKTFVTLLELSEQHQGADIGLELLSSHKTQVQDPIEREIPRFIRE